MGAERREDDIAALALRRFFLGQLDRLDQALHQRLILRDLVGLAAANQVRAAVADLREIEVIVEEACRGRRRAHAADLRVCLRVGVYARVGDLDRLLEAVSEALRRHLVFVVPRFHEEPVDRVGRPPPPPPPPPRPAHPPPPHHPPSPPPHS